MNWLRKLFGGTRGAETARSGPNPTRSPLEALAFRITESGVEPPAGDLDSSQKPWLSKLKKGRRKAVKFRRDFLADRPFLSDPVDEPMRNWHSLGIVFDSSRMESDYGRQVFETFFRQVQPSDIQRQVVLHFGDLIQFEAYCALVARGTELDDIMAVASRFGPEVTASGLLPHSTRFLTAAASDGHLIARSFSLPISATVDGSRIAPDPQAGVGWMVESAVEGTPWKL